jgi:Txe/YoeB family toxin of Txe-Axe toxin-antitoxin module
MRDNSLSKGRVKCHEAISKSIEKEDRVCYILSEGDKVYILSVFNGNF